MSVENAASRLDEEILAEERLAENQELMLYNMSLRQTSQRAAGGREGTHVLVSAIENNPAYQQMIERGLLECRLYGQGGNASAAATLMVTQKGLRYCVLFSEEIEPKRAYDTAGVRRASSGDELRSASSMSYAAVTSGIAAGNSAAKEAAVALTAEQVAGLERIGVERRKEIRHEQAVSFAGASKAQRWTSPSGDVWSYVTANDQYVQITGAASEAKTLHIPAQIEGGAVVAIGADALAMNDTVEEIVCPDCIETIGAGAFSKCTNLKKLVLPANTSKFSAGWISRCPNLEELVLPSLLERVDHSVFENPGLKRLYIGPVACSVEPGAFQKSQLEELVIDEANPYIVLEGNAIYTKDRRVLLTIVRPVRALVVADGCQQLAKKCCYGFEGLEEVLLPESLTEVGPYAFGYSGLAAFKAPTSLRTIGEKAFYRCRSLQEAFLNEGLESIGESAFEGSGLQALALPGSIVSLGKSMTRNTGIVHSGPGCTLTIADGCTTMFLDGEGGLYQRCEDGPHLVQLVDPDMERYRVFDGAVCIDAYAFAYHGCIESIAVPGSVREIGKSAFRICRKLRHVELPDFIERIGDEAFFDTSLEEFRVPANLRELGERALVTYAAHHGNVSPSLTRLSVAPGNDRFYVACGMLCRRGDAGDSIVVFSSSEARVEFPETITRVEEFAFSNARGIEYLALNARLALIGANGLSTKCWIRHVHVEREQPVEGRTSFDFHFPDTPGSIRGIALALGGTSWVNIPGMTEQLDLCLVSAHDYNAPGKAGNISAYAQAKLILDRLDDPVMLTNGNRTMMERVLRDNVEDICVDVVLYDDRAVLDELIARGFLNAENLDGVIERVNTLKDAASTAYLLEAKREKFSSTVFDYDL